METIKIGMLGIGTVAKGTYRTLEMNRRKIEEATGVSLEITKILNRHPERDRGIDIPKEKYVTDADEIFHDPEIQIVVELIGGIDTATEYMAQALASGKHVVTANKAAIMANGQMLQELAQENHVLLRFEASVAGGIPILTAIQDPLAANEFSEILGILNGTTNYILTQMKDNGISLDEAVSQAQQNGYAEANPAADLEGIDAQRKLSILSTIALDGTYVAPSSIDAKGITEITTDDIEFAKKIGCELKLIALFENKEGSKPVAYVAPTYVSRSSLIASVEGVFNAIMVEGNALGESLFYGQGAGAVPTASAVCGDILEAAAGDKMPESRLWEDKGEAVAPYGDVKASIVVRAP